MKDNYGDEITVTAHGADEPYIELDGESTLNVLTAAKARKLAKKLRRAADQIDPRPVTETETSSVAAIAPETETSSVALHAPEAPETSSVALHAPPPFAVGDKVRVSADAYFQHPAADSDAWEAYVDPSFRGEVVTVVDVSSEFGEDVARVELRDGLRNWINRACLTPIDDEPADSGYLLPLTQDEAETLAVILAKIGGPSGYMGETSPRVHASSVADKLIDLGLDGVELIGTGRFPTVDGLGGMYGGSIYFEATS